MKHRYPFIVVEGGDGAGKTTLARAVAADLKDRGVTSVDRRQVSTTDPYAARLMEHLGITGAHTHMLRHQFASEALATDPRELANISQVLGHDSIETTLKFYIHPSADAEARIGAMMNARWTSKPAPARPTAPAGKRAAAPPAAAPAAMAA